MRSREEACEGEEEEKVGRKKEVGDSPPSLSSSIFGIRTYVLAHVTNFLMNKAEREGGGGTRPHIWCINV